MSLKKSFLSLVMAAILVASTATVSVSAREAQRIPMPASRTSSSDEAKIAVRIPFQQSAASEDALRTATDRKSVV